MDSSSEPGIASLPEIKALGRRLFILHFSVLMPLLAVTSWAGAEAEREDALTGRLQELVTEGRIPGLAAALIVRGEVVWTGALGWADLEKRRPMTPSTVLNVGSVSKLVTSTAVLQLWEQGKLALDVDVSRYLPFEVRHPVGNAPLTVRQLLTHTAGLQDGPAYAASYACGEPAVSLEEWLRGYLLPTGVYYDEGNFLAHAPGTVFEYCNVGYGLLGLIAEQVSALDFAELTRRAIFDSLGMNSTGWTLDGDRLARHATPYWYQSEGATPGAEERALLPAGPFEEGDLGPFCLYSFYNYPDGLLRTTIEDLAAFVRATVPGPSVRTPLLSPATRREVFRDQIPALTTDGRVQGLGWRRTEIPELGNLWGHGGADPGIRAQVFHEPDSEITVVAFANRLVGRELLPIIELLLGEGSRRGASLDDEGRRDAVPVPQVR